MDHFDESLEKLKRLQEIENQISQIECKHKRIIETAKWYSDNITDKLLVAELNKESDEFYKQWNNKRNTKFGITAIIVIVAIAAWFIGKIVIGLIGFFDRNSDTTLMVPLLGSTVFLAIVLSIWKYKKDAIHSENFDYKQLYAERNQARLERIKKIAAGETEEDRCALEYLKNNTVSHFPDSALLDSLEGKEKELLHYFAGDDTIKQWYLKKNIYDIIKTMETYKFSFSLVFSKILKEKEYRPTYRSTPAYEEYERRKAAIEAQERQEELDEERHREQQEALERIREETAAVRAELEEERLQRTLDRINPNRRNL